LAAAAQRSASDCREDAGRESFCEVCHKILAQASWRPFTHRAMYLSRKATGHGGYGRFAKSIRYPCDLAPAHAQDRFDIHLFAILA
jgi:hypothetical protein